MYRNISPSEKLKAVKEVLSGKLSVEATARAYGVHPVSLQQWLNSLFTLSICYEGFLLESFCLFSFRYFRVILLWLERNAIVW